MKKGFTLIELLAVILILGIIALIAIPTVTNVIEDSKKGAAKDSVLNYIKAINNQNALATLEPNKYSKIATGDLKEIEVNIKGEKPKDGYVTIENGKVKQALFCINGHMVSYQNGNAITGAPCTKVETPLECFNYAVTNDGAKIKGYYCGTGAENEMLDVIIPSQINNQPVISITDNAFKDTGITSVIIPETVTEIRQYAFKNCSLTSVTIPNSVVTIGRSAFLNNQIASAVIGTGVKTIELSAFNENQLKKIELPDTLETLGNTAFANNQIEELVIPDSVTSMGTGVFFSNLLKTVKISNSITRIEDNTFKNNRLESVTIPNSVKIIGASAFANNRIESLTIGTSVTNIVRYAFSNNRIKNITMPSSVTSIGLQAFDKNSTLTTVTFSNTSKWNVCADSEFDETEQGVKTCKNGVTVENIDLSNTSTNASNLKSTYKLSVWVRNIN